MNTSTEKYEPPYLGGYALPFDWEAIDNEIMKQEADDLVESGEISNWDYAYEIAWNSWGCDEEETPAK